MKEMLVGFLGEILGTILVAVLSLGTAYALSYIAQARDSLQRRTNSQLVDQAIARAAYLAEVAVLAAEGAAAAGIREAVAQGRASRDELVAIGRRVADGGGPHCQDTKSKVSKLQSLLSDRDMRL